MINDKKPEDDSFHLKASERIWELQSQNKELNIELENLRAIHKELIEMGASMGRGYEKENKELIEALKFYARDSSWGIDQHSLDSGRNMDVVAIHFEDHFWKYLPEKSVSGGKLARETLKKLGVE